MDAVDHVVLGAGAVGMAVAEALARRGESVRVVNRSGLREPVAGVQSVAGDVTDPAFAASATRGARVVYQALNPPYHRWAQEFPGLQAAAIAAAQAAGARLVVMDNVYMYGRANGRPFTEDRAYDAHTRKGRVRAAMARDLMAAHDAGRVQVTVGRASDFFGPRAGAQSLIGDWVIPPALADKPASVMGDPDMPHTYTFIPDIGENLVAPRRTRRRARTRLAPAQSRDAHHARGRRTRLPGRRHRAAAEGHAGVADARARTRQPDGPRDQRDALRVRRAVHRRRLPRGNRARPARHAARRRGRTDRALVPRAGEPVVRRGPQTHAARRARVGVELMDSTTTGTLASAETGATLSARAGER